jgi:hypothetical protein
MKKLVLLTLILLGCHAVIAQAIDEERMNRDLEVAKNILATLMKSNSDMYLEGRNLEADYLEGYGVIITIPRHFMYFQIPPPKIKPPKVKIEGIGDVRTIVIAPGDDIESIEETKRTLEETKEAQKEAMKAQEKEMAEMEVEMKEYEEEMKKGMQYWEQNLLEQNEKLEQVMITFLADYADLIGQLKPEDKILINQESPYENYGVLWTTEEGSVESPEFAGLSMEVAKKEITNYKSGKISLEVFKDRINIKTKEPEKKRADLEMFAGIFKQYYSPKLSKTFFTEGTPSYEVLDNYGAIFKIRTYSSYVEGKLYYMPMLGEEKVDSDDRQETIEKLYPIFENDIKNFIIDYGRTIKSLDDDDMLVLKIGMTKCEDCSIPKSIEVMLKMEVLKQYDQQKLTREKALAAIEIKKNFNRSNF